MDVSPQKAWKGWCASGLKDPEISMNPRVQTLGPSSFEIYFTYPFPTGFGV